MHAVNPLRSTHEGPQGRLKLIVSFGDRATEDLFHGRATRRVRSFPQAIIRGVLQKLDVLNSARALKDLRSPPGNRLESLRGGLEGLCSIRVNQQWRLVFHWDGADAYDVRLIDYH
jgi:proteic killer suppression protein